MWCGGSEGRGACPTWYAAGLKEAGVWVGRCGYGGEKAPLPPLTRGSGLVGRVGVKVLEKVLILLLSEMGTG